MQAQESYQSKWGSLSFGVVVLQSLVLKHQSKRAKGATALRVPLGESALKTIKSGSALLAFGVLGRFPPRGREAQ